MRNIKWLGILPILVLVLAACAPAPVATEAPTTNTPTEPLATETPSVAESPAVTGSPEAETPMAETPTTEATTAAESPTAGVPVTGGATVDVSETTDFGPILVNSEGFSLYVLMSDTQNAGTSECTDACAEEWPPLLNEGAPVAGEGVDALLLSTIQRDDGSTQVTYNGWPLYLYQGDTAAGDTNGQGVEDEFGQWFLISPDGEAIQQ